MRNRPLNPEQQLSLTKPELEIILIDMHGRLASCLHYFDELRALEEVPPGWHWLRHRAVILKNLVAKLELAMRQETNHEKETSEEKIE